MGIIRAVKFRLFCVYVCCNMLLCAILFCPWVLPRETISGLLGRWYVMEDDNCRWRFACAGRWLVDRLYFWEPNHCIEVFKCERQARAFLYPEGR